MLTQNTLTEATDSGMVLALAQCRRSVLQRVTTLMHGGASLPFTEQHDALPNVAALLMTSLEELKVAEEEMRQQNTVLLQQREGIDKRADRYHRLFLNAPVAALVTDTLGTIQEANAAAGKLLRRDPDHLEQKPVQALIPAASREEFRRQLARVPLADGVADWRMTLARAGDVPVSVTACVHFVDGVGRTGSGALYWMMRVIDGVG